MGSNYQKDLYKQLMEVMAKVDSLEAGQKQNHKEIKSHTSEAVSLRRENAVLLEEVSSLKKENADLTEKCGKLEIENTLLRNDNERMKRMLYNAASTHPFPRQRMEVQNQPIHTTAGEQPPKSREPRKATKGGGLSKAVVEEKYKRGSTGTA